VALRLTFVVLACCLWMADVDSHATAPQQVRLRGVVLDSTSLAPIAGAEVTVHAQLDIWSASLTNTDSLGRFELAVSSPGAYKLTARFIGYGPRSQDVALPHDSSIAFRFLLVRRPIEVGH